MASSGQSPAPNASASRSRGGPNPATGPKNANAAPWRPMGAQSGVQAPQTAAQPWSASIAAATPPAGGGPAAWTGGNPAARSGRPRDQLQPRRPATAPEQRPSATEAAGSAARANPQFESRLNWSGWSGLALKPAFRKITKWFWHAFRTPCFGGRGGFGEFERPFSAKLTRGDII